MRGRRSRPSRRARRRSPRPRASACGSGSHASTSSHAEVSGSSARISAASSASRIAISGIERRRPLARGRPAQRRPHRRACDAPPRRCATWTMRSASGIGHPDARPAGPCRPSAHSCGRTGSTVEPAARDGAPASAPPRTRRRSVARRAGRTRERVAQSRSALRGSELPDGGRERKRPASIAGCEANMTGQAVLGHGGAEDLGRDLGVGRAAGMKEHAGVVRVHARLPVDAQPSAEACGEERALQAVHEREPHSKVRRQAKACNDLCGPDTLCVRRSCEHSDHRNRAGKRRSVHAWRHAATVAAAARRDETEA